MAIWEDIKKDMVDFRAGCYEKGQGARHVGQGVAPLSNSQAGALSIICHSMIRISVSQ